jgi:prefoldin alpha subunit
MSEMKEKHEKEMQEKYLEMQLMNQQIKRMQKQVDSIETQLSEIVSVKEALDILRSTKTGSELLVPLHSGIFIKAGLMDAKELLVNVGGNVVVSKSVDDTKAMLDIQVKELRSMREELMDSIKSMFLQAQLAEEELTKLVGD